MVDCFAMLIKKIFLKEHHNYVENLPFAYIIIHPSYYLLIFLINQSLIYIFSFISIFYDIIIQYLPLCLCI